MSNWVERITASAVWTLAFRLILWAPDLSNLDTFLFVLELDSLLY